MLCNAEDCKVVVAKKQWCNKHYLRLYRYGSVTYVKNVRHGKKDTPEYRVWTDMKTRCYNKNHKSYSGYGGKGVKVCDSWAGRNGFMNFFSDMGERPSSKHSIDRIDGTKGYSPSNCRWATATQQNINKKIPYNNKSGYRGVSWYKLSNKWRAAISIDGRLRHLGYFDHAEEAAKAYNEAASCRGVS